MRRVRGASPAQTVPPPVVAPTSRPNFVIAPVYSSRGPGRDGVNMQVTSFFDAMIRPIPAERSPVSVPTFARPPDCAKVGTGIAAASTVARMARAVKDLYTVHSCERTTLGVRKSLAQGRLIQEIFRLFALADK